MQELLKNMYYLDGLNFGPDRDVSINLNSLEIWLDQ